MAQNMKSSLSREIIEKALEFGADLAGIARVEDLKKSPSHMISEKMPQDNNVASKQVEGRKQGVVEWPEGGKSALVIAVAHPPEKPELDWWVLGGKSAAGNTEGNRILMRIVKKVAEWLEQEKSVRSFKLPYHIEHGGIYMKDTAVMAGLGCIGKNNILVTPQYGPRQRLRIVLLDMDLPATGPIDFDPCLDCHMPCRSACPVNAFSETIYTEEEYGVWPLPGRTGVYSRPRCHEQMDIDTANQESVAVEGEEAPVKKTKFCRACEFACPVGDSKAG